MLQNCLQTVTLFILILCVYNLYSGARGARSEFFALDSKIILGSKLGDIDMNTWYFPGKRVKSNTVTEAKNGGTACPEYDAVAYKKADPVNAVCRPEITDDVYEFENAAKQGWSLTPGGTPFYLRHSNSNACVHPYRTDNPADDANAVWYNGGCGEPKTQFVYDPNARTLKHKTSGKCLRVYRDGTNNGDRIGFGPCNQQFSFENGVLKHIPSGKCIHPEGGSNTPGNETNLVIWDCGTDKSKTGIQPRMV